MNRGMISKIFDWFLHPGNDNSTITQWIAGLVVLIILSFLWSTVVRGIVE